MIYAYDVGGCVCLHSESAGAMYHSELARQLCDVLLPRVREAHGMILLADAYCILNRGRGTALVSPEDFLKAAQSLQSLSLPLRLRAFTSGVLVLQDAAHDDRQAATLLADELRKASVRQQCNVHASRIVVVPNLSS